ncbi:MAG: hypothetical protein HY609_06575 [Deltaproteobacteria bacterium]|nr:hypothetical protein [Deltaproteobacteria bacterium]MBI4224583.1 hypothetical protein [Deltaproteobacteria bacterium]
MAILNPNFVVPAFAGPASFSQAVVGGPFDQTQLAWTEAAFEQDENLAELAGLLQAVREGRFVHSSKIEAVASKHQTKIRMALMRGRSWKVDATPTKSFGLVPQEVRQSLHHAASLLHPNGASAIGWRAAGQKPKTAIPGTVRTWRVNPEPSFEDAKRFAEILVRHKDSVLLAEYRNMLIQTLPLLSPVQHLELLSTLFHIRDLFYDLLNHLPEENKLRLFRFLSEEFQAFEKGSQRMNLVETETYVHLLLVLEDHHFEFPLKRVVSLERNRLLTTAVPSVFSNRVQRLRGDPAVRPAALAVMNDRSADAKKRLHALIDYAYSFCGEISYAAVRLILLKGERWLKGEASEWEFLAEGADPADFDFVELPDGEKIRELATDLLEQENTLRGLPTVGGKVRDILGRAGVWQGFVTWHTLLKGEEENLLLWPARDPRTLAETVEELLRRGAQSSHPFRLSVTVSGRVGDTLKPAALAVEALLPSPFPYPKVIKAQVPGFEWFAPVVEGGYFGPLGFINLDDPRDQTDQSRARRYDYLFTAFVYPPGAGFFFPEDLVEPKPRWRERLKVWERWFPPSTDPADTWRRAFRRFTLEYQPELLSLREDPRGNGIVVLRLTRQEKSKRIIWRPSASDQKAMMVASQTDLTFEVRRRFFVEWMRDHARQAWQKVMEAAWALEVLRKGPELVLSTGGSFSPEQQAALIELGAFFWSEMKTLIGAKGLGRILKTPWVGNKDWRAIRKDMTAYQEAMAQDPAWKQEIVDLIEATVLDVRQILRLE